MVNGPPCAVCGWTLRWLPAQASWGCDRCQRMFPAQAAPAQGYGQPAHGHGPAQAYGQPAPQGHAPPYSPDAARHTPYSPFDKGGPAPVAPAPAPRARQGLVIGLAVAAVAIAGGVVAFVLLRGGGGAGGSRDAVVNATLAALAAGDAKALARLHDPHAVFAKVADCDDATELDADAKQDRDPAAQLAKLETTYADVVAKTRGMKLELVTIVTQPPPALQTVGGNAYGGRGGGSGHTDARWTSIEKGDKLSKGCVAKQPLRLHEVKLRLKVTREGQPANEQEATIRLVEVDGGWFLGQPPEIATTSFADVRAMFEEARTQACACKDVACIEALEAAFKQKVRDQQLERVVKQLAKAEQDALETIEDEIEACEDKLAQAGGDQATQAALDQMAAYRDRMCACADRACADRINTEMVAWAQTQKDTQPSPEAMRRAATIGEELGKCMQRAMTGDATGSAGGSTVGSTIAQVSGQTIAGGGGDFPAAAGLPAGCEEYRQALQKISACPKYPASARQALVDAWQQMVKGLGDVSKLPAASLDAIGDGCRQGSQAMQQAAAAMGC